MTARESDSSRPPGVADAVVLADLSVGPESAALWTAADRSLRIL